MNFNCYAKNSNGFVTGQLLLLTKLVFINVVYGYTRKRKIIGADGGQKETSNYHQILVNWVNSITPTIIVTTNYGIIV